MNTILVVDDDPNNQRMLSYSLRKQGYNVLIAANGQLGWEALEQHPVDLAILDISMPVLDGISLLRLIRTHPTLAHLPVIILTASGNDQELQIAEEIGVQAFLTKPSSSRVLLETVQTLVQTAGLGQ
jgi:CheY-like chemotaxis protein